MIETAQRAAPVAGADPALPQADSAANVAMNAAREELALVSAQINDGHTQLVTLIRRVLAEDLWCGAGFRSPEQWLTAYAGLTWSSAHDIVHIAERCADLPTMRKLLDQGRLTLGLAAVIAKYTPATYDADVAEFASYTTVTQLRRALCRYEFHTAASDSPSDETTDDATRQDSAVIPGDAADDEEQVNAATDAATDRAPGQSDPATAPPRLDMRYTAGRFHLTYDAPADIGALVEQALLEAKDTLFHLNTPTDPATDHPTAAGGGDAPTHPGTAACGKNPPAPATSRKGATFGEAFGLMAQRSLDAGAPLGHSRASRYRVYLHLDTLGNGWLNKGCALPPSLRARVLCDGIIQPIWETEGKPVSVGRTQRVVPARTRRLLEDRDRGCRYPGCLARHHLEAHHLDHWIDGGLTDADRMIMLCPFHHDEHHRGTFVMVGDPSRPDGVTFTARDGTKLRPDFRPHTPPTSPVNPYTGPVNEKLHLSLVRFDPRPQPEDSPPDQDPDRSTA